MGAAAAGPAGQQVAARRMTVARGFARHMAGIDPTHADAAARAVALPPALAAAVHLLPRRHRGADGRVPRS